ncbi:MAG: YHS domain-containing (seleno)protein [Gammaproteobacteria bacterium]|jgi:YHS domain-containing protein
MVNKAVKGFARYSATYDGVEFWFANADRRKAFKDNPQRYIPRYNGFCAFAVGASNAKVPANPDTFKFYNGQLLVFFNDMWDGEKFNTKTPWNDDELSLYSKAETNWKTLQNTR